MRLLRCIMDAPAEPAHAPECGAPSYRSLNFLPPTSPASASSCFTSSASVQRRGFLPSTRRDHAIKIERLAVIDELQVALDRVRRLRRREQDVDVVIVLRPQVPEIIDAGWDLVGDL